MNGWKLLLSAWLLMARLCLTDSASAAGLVSPLGGLTYRGSFEIRVDPPCSQIVSVLLYRAWPYIGYFEPYKVFTGGLATNVWTIDEDSITCGEYQAVVELSSGEFLVSYLFIVLTPTPLMWVWLPDQYSTANAGDTILVRWDYFGDQFTPTVNSAHVHVIGPKGDSGNEECEESLDSGIRVFGPGKVKVTLSSTCRSGVYTIQVVQDGWPDNVESVQVWVDSAATVRPQLSLSPWKQPGVYLLHIGPGTSGPWNLEYSFNLKQWYWAQDFLWADTHVLLESASQTLYVRLRKH